MASASDSPSVIDAVENILPEGMKIKPKQLEALNYVISGKDTLCILPTSFGKSLIFQLNFCLHYLLPFLKCIIMV